MAIFDFMFIWSILVVIFIFSLFGYIKLCEIQAILEESEEITEEV